MARIGQPIKLTIAEKQELLTMGRSHKLEKRYVDRANIILYSDEGKSLDEIAGLTGKSKPVVNKWRQRFRNGRVKGAERCLSEWKAKNHNPRTKSHGH